MAAVEAPKGMIFIEFIQDGLEAAQTA